MVEASVCAEIDLSALRHNLEVARRLAPRSHVMGVIKSNAYGHGTVPVARTLEPHVEALGVARMEEGLALREAGIRCPLVVLEGALWPYHLEQARRHDLQLVIHDAHQVRLLQADSSLAPLSCWLKIDTGMHRLGFAPEQARDCLAGLRALPQVRMVGWMTHLANADARDDPTTIRQVERLRAVTEGSGLPLSIANSAGVMGWPDSHADWVRPGIMLYGASPLAGRSAQALGLRPVMTLSAPLISVKEVAGGAKVGYGGTWRAPRAMPLGIVGIGYGDGFPRHIRSPAQASLNGRRVDLLGRVSMDMVAVDLRGVGKVRVGDRVVLWGEGLPADELAAHCETIAYTLFCGVTGRVQRRYIQ